MRYHKVLQKRRNRMSVIKVGAEREQVFDRTLRYDRQKDYDINKYEIKEFDFKAGHRQVYGNFNFSIFVDEFCNADCKFCVAQLRYENKKLLYHKEHLPDDIWLKRCEEILKLVRPLNPSISITGGEPTLSKKLVPVLQMVDALGFRKRTITTNGSYLFHKVDGLPIIDHLIRNHWDHLNISRPSISDADARSIMRFSNEYNFTSNEMVRDILAEANKSSLKHRLSCLLLKEGVNSVDMMKAYVHHEWLQGVWDYEPNDGEVAAHYIIRGDTLIYPKRCDPVEFATYTFQLAGDTLYLRDAKSNDEWKMFFSFSGGKLWTTEVWPDLKSKGKSDAQEFVSVKRDGR